MRILLTKAIFPPSSSSPDKPWPTRSSTQCKMNQITHAANLLRFPVRSLTQVGMTVTQEQPDDRLGNDTRARKSQFQWLFVSLTALGFCLLDPFELRFCQ